MQEKTVGLYNDGSVECGAAPPLEPNHWEERASRLRVQNFRADAKPDPRRRVQPFQPPSHLHRWARISMGALSGVSECLTVAWGRLSVVW